MALLAGPYLVTAALLAAGGAAKVVKPAPTARAMGEMGLRVPAVAVRAGAAVELAIAAGALAGAGRAVALLVGASYVGFAAFVGAALARGVPLASCGCFGVEDTPPTAVHLGVNLAAAAVAGAVALGAGGAGGLTEITAMDGSLVLRGAFVVLTAASAWFAYAALTLLPKLNGAAR
jgi:hypothetical protein